MLGPANSADPDNNWQWVAFGSALWEYTAKADRRRIGGLYDDDEQQCFIRATSAAKAKAELDKAVDKLLTDCGL